MLLVLMCFWHLHSRIEEASQHTSTCCLNARDLCRKRTPFNDRGMREKPSGEENDGKGFGTERRTVHKLWPVDKPTRHVRYSYQCLWILWFPCFISMSEAVSWTLPTHASEKNETLMWSVDQLQIITHFMTWSSRYVKRKDIIFFANVQYTENF